jgi:hypothetical protein|tara:strand:- start:808 stop:1017 length:210 start_codon:yes stop_codon:yes gene_type:complete
MNDLQKKFATIGLTAFIVWVFLGYDKSEIWYYIDDFNDFIFYFITGTWLQTTTFITWVGSLIAFNIYKD